MDARHSGVARMSGKENIPSLNSSAPLAIVMDCVLEIECGKCDGRMNGALGG